MRLDPIVHEFLLPPRRPRLPAPRSRSRVSELPAFLTALSAVLALAAFLALLLGGG